jgi:phenylpyruvate tautomerase PptA (4-oxalocrotonate tautomerase family)
VVSLAVLGLIGAGAHGVFTTSTVSSQKITVGAFGGPPTVQIVFPVNVTTYGTDWPGAITGTASPGPGATVTQLKVSVQQATGLCWTGAGNTYSATCPNYVAVTTGTTSWSLTFPRSDLTSGDSYKVTAQATDSDGSVATSSTVSFTYDTAPPTVTITYPSSGANVCACSWNDAIKGTASSNAGPGTIITGVSVAIENTTTDMWWDGIAFESSTKTFVEATGTTRWSLPLGGSSLKTGDTYAVTAEAADSLGNLGVSATVTFTYCLKTGPPKVAISYPVGGAIYGSDWTGSITGTAAAGTGATVTSVSVAIENTKTSRWWNGSSFGASGKRFVTATGTTTWMLGLPSTDLSSGVTYKVVAEATDSLADTGTSATVLFTYYVKTAPPTVAITYPLSGTTYGSNWSGEITGSASAAAGATVKSVSVAIEDTTSKSWWNGSSFGASAQTFNKVTGTTTWMYGLATTSFSSGHSYAVVAEATDDLSNTGTSATVDFSYLVKTPPPKVTITFPANNVTYTSWTGPITGTASAGAGAAITGVSVAIEDTATKTWWNGTSFGAGSQSYIAATGTTTWLLALPASSLTSGVTYTVVAEATDNLGNVGTSSTVSFTYCVKTAPPTVTTTYPENNAAYGSNWTGEITGTAASNSGANTTITAVSVAIEDAETSMWWNGSSFTATKQTFVAAAGTTTWSLTLAGSNLTSGVTYSVVAEATDSLKNLGTAATVSFTYSATTGPPSLAAVFPSHMGDCGGPCSTGIWWTITGTNFVAGAKVSFPGTGPSADFSVVSGSVMVLDSTSIALRVRDTGATEGKATVVVTDPGKAPAFGSIIATGKSDPTSLSIIGQSTLAQGASTTLRLGLSGSSCTTWGTLAVYFSNPGITAGTPTCTKDGSGYSVSLPIAVSATAFTGDSSVTLMVGNQYFALSTDGLTIEDSPHG